MRTPKLDALVFGVFPHGWQREFVDEIKSEVDEEIRAACEKAWNEGVEFAADGPVLPSQLIPCNPYRKAGT